MGRKEDIIALPNPSLRKKSVKVKAVSGEIRKLIADMKTAGLDWEDSREHEVCVGLAAVQIDVHKRVVIIRSSEPDDREFQVLINPRVIKTYGEPELDFEGCLSVKDIYGVVPRYPKVKVQATDEEGREFRMTAEGFDARLLQHEVDHTEGVVFVDHIFDQPEAFHRINAEGKIVKMDYNDVEATGIFR